jgi:hypothetical protein
LRFSEKDLRLANGAAEVEVTGELPVSLADWRGGSTAALAYVAPADSPEPAPSRSKTPTPAPAPNARRRVSA